MTETVDDLPRSEIIATNDGRLTIPAHIRRAANIEPGQRLIAYVDKGRVVLEERTHLMRRLQDEAIAAKEASGFTGSAVDELIAMRRAEAEREERRW